MLGLCQLKMDQELDSLKKLKINILKEKTLNILKGVELMPKPVLEWLRPRIHNNCIIQKTFLNLNNTGSTTSLYILSIRSFVNHKYSKILLPNLKGSFSEKKLIVSRKENTALKTSVFHIKNLPTYVQSPRKNIKLAEIKSKINLQTSSVPIITTFTPKIVRKPKAFSNGTIKLTSKGDLPHPQVETETKAEKLNTLEDKSSDKFLIPIPKNNSKVEMSPKIGPETLTPWDVPSKMHDSGHHLMHDDVHTPLEIVEENGKESDITTLRMYMTTKSKHQFVLN